MKISHFIALLAASIFFINPAFGLELSHIETIDIADANSCGDENIVSFYKISDVQLSDTFLEDGKEIIVGETNIDKFRKVVGDALGDWIDPSSVVVTGDYDLADLGLINRFGVYFDEFDNLQIMSCHEKDMVEKFGIDIDMENKQVYNRLGFKNYIMSPIYKGGVFATTSVFVSINQRDKTIGVYYIY